MSLFINKLSDKFFYFSKNNIKFILSYIIYKVYTYYKSTYEKLINIQSLLYQMICIAFQPLIILKS